MNRWLIVYQQLHCAVFSDSYLPIIERNGSIEDDYIILGYCIGLTASEMLNVYTAQWQL
jgi:hypothetical protein